MKYAVLTFGCRSNQADSFEVARELQAAGGVSSGVDAADLVVVNTCAVTATAEQAARQAIRRVARLNPRARIVATGCYAARAGAGLAGEVGAAATVEIVRRESGRRDPPPDGSGSASIRLSPSGLGHATPNGRPAPMPAPGANGRTTFLLRVQTGCDEACSYCIVPSTRGRSRSLALEQAMDAVRQAASAGYKHVCVTGVHLGSYGRDLEPASTLGSLVAALGAHPADVTFRLSAIEPMDVDVALVDAIASSGRFAPHFHLPLQHASDRVLSEMGRTYRLADFTRTVESLRNRFPDAAIGSDVIVGFPGESEDDFALLLKYVASSSLSYVHVFPFSSRPGTKAASLAGRPSGAEVRHRVIAMRAAAATLASRFRARFIDAVRDALTIDDGSEVLTDNYLRVRIAPGLPPNERVQVRILREVGGGLTGTLVSRITAARRQASEQAT